ncbi:unnamed protein product [Polarella glacialis]|uniref:Uncharacterized protein n=1 Tax=Polarella glacialis TaxID=89957 RepID=A0A813J2T6_POLGL|nr:unnamed protein product [Polarella glacialis]
MWAAAAFLTGEESCAACRCESHGMTHQRAGSLRRPQNGVQPPRLSFGCINYAFVAPISSAQQHAFGSRPATVLGSQLPQAWPTHSPQQQPQRRRQQQQQTASSILAPPSSSSAAVMRLSAAASSSSPTGMAFQRPLAGDAGNPVVQVSSSEEEEGDPYVQEILADSSWVKDGGRAAVEDEVRFACDGSWSVAVPSRGAASRQDVVVPSDDSCDSDFEASGLKSDVGSEYFEFRGPRPRRESAGVDAQKPGREGLDTAKDKRDKKAGKDKKDKKDKKTKKDKTKQTDQKEHQVKMDEKHKKDQKDRKSEAHDGEVENTQEKTPDDQRNNKEAHAKKARNEAGPEIAELEDAPAGHIAYEAVKELPAHEWPYAYFIFRRSDDETIRLQATEKQAGSMARAAKICRLCYMRLAAGNSRSEAFAYRSELYHRITPSK